ADVGNLRADLDAIPEILASEVGCGVPDLQGVVTGISEREDGFRLHRLSQGTRACSLARKDAAGDFFARSIQQAKERIEKRRGGSGSLDVDGDVGGLIQVKARTMDFVRPRESPFEGAWDLERHGLGSGAIRFDRRLSRVGAATPSELVQTAG